MLLLRHDVVPLVLQDLLDICERPGDDVDEEVIHDISVVSLECVAGWSSVGVDLDDTCMEFGFTLVLILRIHLLGLNLLFICVGQKSHLIIFQDDVDVVVKLDIHLNIEEDIEITVALLDVATFVWNRALSRQDFGQVVVLNISESLFVILGASAAKIMKVVDERENPSMLEHELDQSHSLSRPVLGKVFVEQGGEDLHDDVDLGIVQDLEGLLVLELKVSFVS